MASYTNTSIINTVFELLTGERRQHLWPGVRKIILNADKTKEMIINSGSKMKEQQTPIFIDGTEVER